MATAFNCNVRLYKGCPLVKGGSGVLFVGGAAAAGIIPGQYRTYSQYSYSRENRNAIQIGAPIADLDGCNYIAFQNAAHGGKWFFGFIDHVNYINDNNTEIQFTIDPFPTFIGDTTVKDEVYVLRNTVRTDTRGKYVTDDYLPKTAGQRWNAGISSDYSYPCKTLLVYFIANQTFGSSWHIMADTTQTAIQCITNPTDQEIGDIRSGDGEILGAYLVPGTMATPQAVYQRTDLQIHGSSLGSFRHNKILTGVYHKVSLSSTQGRKYYEMEDFADPMNISFGVMFYKFPAPSIIVYPKNYQGVAENLAEGLTMNTPSVPISVPTVYTQGQMVGDLFGIAGGAIATAALGAATGGAALIPAAVGALGGVIGMGANALNAAFQPPKATGSSTPAVTTGYSLGITLSYVSPGLDTLNAIDDYFDYFGYSINDVLTPSEINLDNGAFIQTGTALVSGSEGDQEINARIMAGVKVIKSF